MTMKPELKQKWVEALRSGKFEQGTGHLKYNYTGEDQEKRDCYCCLGVLCVILKDQYPSMAENITIEPNGIKVLEYYEDDFVDDLIVEHDVGQELSGEICQLIGLPDTEMSYLIGLNDDDKASFEEIADYIEKKL